LLLVASPEIPSAVIRVPSASEVKVECRGRRHRETQQAEEEIVENEQKKTIGRRALIRGAAGLAAVGAVVGVPALVFLPNSDDGGAPRAVQDGMPVESGEPLIVFIQDAAKGEVMIMAGTNETLVTDHALVSRLMNAWSL
jgi:hypothetical protein